MAKGWRGQQQGRVLHCRAAALSPVLLSMPCRAGNLCGWLHLAAAGGGAKDGGGKSGGGKGGGGKRGSGAATQHTQMTRDLPAACVHPGATARQLWLGSSALYAFFSPLYLPLALGRG